MNSALVKDEQFQQPLRLSEDEMPEVAALERACFSHPWTEEQLCLGVRENVLHVLGIRRYRRLVAYCSFYVAASQADIVNIAVLPEFRRKRLGSSLLTSVLQHAGQIGVEQIFLEVRESNLAARTLYLSKGFEKVGLRARYYPDNGEDALLMAFDLTILNNGSSRNTEK